MAKWPPVASLAAKYQSKPVHFIFANPWPWGKGVMEKIQPRLPSGGWKDDQPNFTACKRVAHPKVDRSVVSKRRLERQKDEDLPLLGTYVLFDRSGTLAEFAPLLPHEVDARIAKLLATKPVALDTGAGEYTVLKALAKQVAAGKRLGGALAKCEQTIADAAAPAAKRDEARRLRDALRWWATDQEQGALDCLAKDPARTERRYAALAKAFRGSDLATQVTQRLKQLTQAGEITAALAFEKIHDAIKAVAPCSLCGGKLKCTGIAVTCNKCRDARKDELARLRPALQAWLAKYPASRVRPVAEELDRFIDPAVPVPGRRRK